MNEADVRAHSHSVNESMSNTDSDKKQSTKLRKRQLKCVASTGGKKKKKTRLLYLLWKSRTSFSWMQAQNFPINWNLVPSSLVSLMLALLVCFSTGSSQSLLQPPMGVYAISRAYISQEAFMSTQGRTQQTWWDLRYRRPKVRGQYSLMFFFKAVFQDYLQGGFVFFYFGTNINLDSEMNWCGINLMPPDTDYLKNKEDFITCGKMNWFIARSREYAYIFIKPHQLSFSLNLSSSVKSK